MRFTQAIIWWCALLGTIRAIREEGPFTKQFEVNIQIKEPSGIMVWTKDNPMIYMFGVELFVTENEEVFKNPVVDRSLLVYTSTTLDGKFIIRDDHMMVKRGEIIRYRFLIVHNKIFNYSNFRRINVTDDLFYRPKNNYCFSKCLESDQNQAPEEVTSLKAILEQKIMQCVGSQASKYLFFPLKNATKLVFDSERYVKYRLWQVEALKPLIDNVVTTYLAHNGVGFQMYSLIDKFKILELGEGYLEVVDLDTIY